VARAIRLVTTAADFAPGVLACRNASQCEEENYNGYQISRPLNWI